MAIRVRMTEEGLLIPREVAEWALGAQTRSRSSRGAGRLLISPVGESGEAEEEGTDEGEDRPSLWTKTPWRTLRRRTSR